MMRGLSTPNYSAVVKDFHNAYGIEKSAVSENFISEGDIVYAPAKRWHLPEPYGEGQSCWLAMTPYPAGNHLYQPRP